jgi:hypothetical protein
VFRVYRIAGRVDGKLVNNIAWAGMTVAGGLVGDTGADGQDGADTTEKPEQSAYTAMGWDFSTIWQMGANGYPALRQ